jgi:small subunit ribosomal protein S16
VLKIRLRRTGAKKQPRYRVVVAESSAPRDGSFVEILGWYNPQADPAQVVINTEKAAEWIKRGAQPSDRVAYLLKQAAAGATGDTVAAAPPPEPVAAEPPAEEEAAKPATRSRARSTRASAAAKRTAASADERAGESAPEEGGASGAAADVSASEAPEEEGSAGTAS